MDFSLALVGAIQPGLKLVYRKVTLETFSWILINLKIINGDSRIALNIWGYKEIKD
jgi:hypothetical protein